MGWLSGFFWTASGVFALFAALLYLHQGKLLYFPNVPIKSPDDNPKGYRNPGEQGLPYSDIYMVTKDGVTIHGWLLQQPEPSAVPTIVYFHGNAGNIGFRLPSAEKMFGHLKCNIFMVEYRGYGKSEGSPTEKGLELDAEAALRALRENPHSKVDPTKVIVFGRSLGGAVALAAAEQHPDLVAAVVVENTFLSIGHMVDVLLPVLKPFKSTLLNIDWPNDRRIQSIKQPVLLISGLKDELVPPWHMKQLHFLAKRARFASIVYIEGGTHNDTWVMGDAKYYGEMSKFITAVFTDRPPPPPSVDRGAAEEETICTSRQNGGSGSDSGNGGGLDVEGPATVVDAVPPAIPTMPRFMPSGKKKGD